MDCGSTAVVVWQNVSNPPQCSSGLIPLGYFSWKGTGFTLFTEPLVWTGASATRILYIDVTFNNVKYQPWSAMSHPVTSILLVPTRICLWFLTLQYWVLLYGMAVITSCLVLSRIAWRVMRDPNCLSFSLAWTNLPMDCTHKAARLSTGSCSRQSRLFVGQGKIEIWVANPILLHRRSEWLTWW